MRGCAGCTARAAAHAAPPPRFTRRWTRRPPRFTVRCSSLCRRRRAPLRGSRSKWARALTQVSDCVCCPCRATSCSSPALCAPFAASCRARTRSTPTSPPVRRWVVSLGTSDSRSFTRRHARRRRRRCIFGGGRRKRARVRPRVRRRERRAAAVADATSRLAPARWADAAPYPEWELVTDEEPCASDAEPQPAPVSAEAAPVAIQLDAQCGGAEEQARFLPCRTLRCLARWLMRRVTGGGGGRGGPGGL